MKRTFGRLVGLVLATMLIVQTAGVAFALRRKREVINAPHAASDEVTLASIFGPLDFRSTAQAFRGGSLSCLYGGGILDLRGATLAPGGANLRVQAFNGGAQILIPASWRLEAKVMGLGGGDAPRRSIAHQMRRFCGSRVGPCSAASALHPRGPGMTTTASSLLNSSPPVDQEVTRCSSIEPDNH